MDDQQPAVMGLYALAGFRPFSLYIFLDLRRFGTEGGTVTVLNT